MNNGEKIYIIFHIKWINQQKPSSINGCFFFDCVPFSHDCYHLKNTPNVVFRKNVSRQIVYTHCVLNVNAALVILDGRCSPLMISCHNFLLITSTSPPRAITKLYSSYKSNTDLAIIGRRLMGVPEKDRKHIDVSDISKKTMIMCLHIDLCCPSKVHSSARTSHNNNNIFIINK